MSLVRHSKPTLAHCEQVGRTPSQRIFLLRQRSQACAMRLWALVPTLMTFIGRMPGILRDFAQSSAVLGQRIVALACPSREVFFRWCSFSQSFRMFPVSWCSTTAGNPVHALFASDWPLFVLFFSFRLGVFGRNRCELAAVSEKTREGVASGPPRRLTKNRAGVRLG